MNIQEVLVYIFILAAISYTLYNIIQIFRKKDGSSCACSSCNLKNDITDLKKIRKNISKSIIN